jgi:hypothetical protein
MDVSLSWGLNDADFVPVATWEVPHVCKLWPLLLPVKFESSSLVRFWSSESDATMNSSMPYHSLQACSHTAARCAYEASFMGTCFCANASPSFLLNMHEAGFTF